MLWRDLLVIKYGIELVFFRITGWNNADVLIRFEDYLLDRYYRPENDDVQAQDVLLEFSLYAPTSSIVDF